MEEIASHLNLTTSRAGQIKLRMEKDGWVSPETRGVSKNGLIEVSADFMREEAMAKFPGGKHFGSAG